MKFTKSNLVVNITSFLFETSEYIRNVTNTFPYSFNAST